MTFIKYPEVFQDQPDDGTPSRGWLVATPTGMADGLYFATKAEATAHMVALDTPATPAYVAADGTLRPCRRFADAYGIQQGACNPSGIARTLVAAIDEARAVLSGTDAVRNDPAVRLIVHQLAFLCNVGEYDTDPSVYNRDYAICEEQDKLINQSASTL